MIDWLSGIKKSEIHLEGLDDIIKSYKEQLKVWSLPKYDRAKIESELKELVELRKEITV